MTITHDDHRHLTVNRTSTAPKTLDTLAAAAAGLWVLAPPEALVLQKSVAQVTQRSSILPASLMVFSQMPFGRQFLPMNERPSMVVTLVVHA